MGAQTSRKESNARLSDLAYDRLKTEIVRCHLKPGEEVTESQLAERYGLGKAPLRNALSRLCHDRLVEALPRRGHLITPITIRDIVDLFEIRLMLEPTAARLAAGHVDRDRILQCNADCEAAYQPGDRESEARYLECNTKFHMMIARASGNRRLAAMIAQLLEESQRVRHLGLMVVERKQVMGIQHGELIEALLANDGAAAAEITARHIKTGQEMVLNAVLATPDVLDRQIEIGIQTRGASGGDGGRAAGSNQNIMSFPEKNRRGDSEE